jgi:ribonuclease D
MQAFRRIKCRGSPRFFAVLRELAAWRERQAQNRDLLRGRILRDEALTEIAHHTPTTTEDLARTRGLGRGFADGAAGAEVLAAVQRGLAVPDDECPRPETKPAVPRGAMPVAEILKVLLKLQCEEHDVAQRLVASVADIETIAAFGDDCDVPALHGWRRTVFGEAALELRAGRVGLAVRGRRLILVDLPPASRDGSACRTSAP